MAARKRPLVPEDRKASKAAERAAMQDQRLKMRQAMDTGDEKFLPLRDKGPQKRFARDYVDARFSLGEYLMFGALVFVVVSLLVPASSEQMIYVLGAFWVMFLAVFVDVFILSRKLKKRLAEKFGDVERGTVWYGSMRSLQFRTPPPAQALGQARRVPRLIRDTGHTRCPRPLAAAGGRRPGRLPGLLVSGLSAGWVLRQLPVDACGPEGALVKERRVALHQGGAGVEPFLDVLRGLDAADGDQGELTAGWRP